MSYYRNVQLATPGDCYVQTPKRRVQSLSLHRKSLTLKLTIAGSPSSTVTWILLVEHHALISRLWLSMSIKVLTPILTFGHASIISPLVWTSRSQVEGHIWMKKKEHCVGGVGMCFRNFLALLTSLWVLWCCSSACKHLVLNLPLALLSNVPWAG